MVFNTNGGKGQSRLERVLFAYSVANPEVGYTQGMNYIVALLLGYMPEEEVFVDAAPPFAPVTRATGTHTFA